MEDDGIVALYFARNEQALEETAKVETLQCKNHSEKGRTNQSPSESGQKIRLC